MTAEIQALNPEHITMKLTVSMTIREWEALAAQLNTVELSAWPGWQFKAHISTLIERAKKHFMEIGKGYNE